MIMKRIIIFTICLIALASCRETLEITKISEKSTYTLQGTVVDYTAKTRKGETRTFTDIKKKYKVGQTIKRKKK